MRYESTLNRGAMIANYEINCGVLNAEQKAQLLEVADELDDALCHYSNVEVDDRPPLEFYVSVFLINGRFYGDWYLGSRNINLDCPTAGEAANDLGIADESGFDWDEIERRTEWSYCWAVL